MMMTTRDEIALKIMCAMIAGEHSPAEGLSFPEIGYRDADMFIAEMLKQQELRGVGSCIGGKDHQLCSNDDGSISCYRCNQAL
jgi:hypothetical protein